MPDQVAADVRCRLMGNLPRPPPDRRRRQQANITVRLTARQCLLRHPTSASARLSAPSAKLTNSESDCFTITKSPAIEQTLPPHNP
jgi:hypothetical protein